jgi:NADPH2 dehydrogenase
MNSTPADPLPTYEYLVAQLKTRYPELAYIHVVEPRIKGDVDQPNHEYAAVAASTASKSASTPSELGNALEALSLNEPASSPKPTHTAPSNDSLRALWAPKLFISAGGYTRETALVAAERGNELVAFGRRFLANVSTYCL